MHRRCTGTHVGNRHTSLPSAGIAARPQSSVQRANPGRLLWRGEGRAGEGRTAFVAWGGGGEPERHGGGDTWDLDSPGDVPQMHAAVVSACCIVVGTHSAEWRGGEGVREFPPYCGQQYTVVRCLARLSCVCLCELYSAHCMCHCPTADYPCPTTPRVHIVLHNKRSLVCTDACVNIYILQVVSSTIHAGAYHYTIRKRTHNTHAGAYS